MSTKMSTQKIVLLVLYAVALAMGVAAIVLPLLGQSVDQTMIGIALFCLGIAGLNIVTEKS
ncbi:MAG: hypothetical protein OEV85_09900 [Candidatus Thorarchaeota archaeon]|nr:hypothetical protein [Candidatus Thorarchaeota archaeon]